MTSHNAREPVEAIPEALIDASAELCRALGIPSSPINCLPIIGALKADRQRDQWQPIDTAPHDGKFLVAQYAPTNWAYRVNTVVVYPDMPKVREQHLRYCTHWMPLPAPPKTEG